MAEEEENELEGIYQGILPRALPETLRVEFKPWHKPRKHYIRIKQWCHEVTRLIRSLRLPEGGELRYLGLPGEDLLDLWVLRGVCEQAKLKLRYIGFDSSRRSAISNLASHRVNSTDFIHPSSTILPDPLNAILKDSTLAFRQTDQNAPYDIVNLDLCDSILNQTLPYSFPNMEVVRAICDIQKQRRGQAWVLFLTFRIIRDGIDQPTLGRMFHCIIENLNKDPRFEEALRSTLGIEGEEIKTATDIDGFDDQRWSNCNTLAFAKWLLTYLTNIGCGVTMLDSYIYNIVHDRKDMVSLGFRIEPVGTIGIDPSGMTTGRATQQTTIDEVGLACAMVEKIAAMPDLDGLLAADSELRETFVSKKATLLANVGYDADAYRNWVVSADPVSQS